MVKECNESPEVEQCLELLLLIIAGIKKEPITAEDGDTLASSLKHAIRSLKETKDYIAPATSVPALRKSLTKAVSLSQQLNDRLGGLLNDQRVQAALTDIKEKANLTDADNCKHGLLALIAATPHLALIGKILGEVETALPATRGSSSNYRIVPMMHLVEAWTKILGDYPGVSSNIDSNSKTGPFVQLVQTFFKQFGYEVPSGDSIDNYLDELSVLFPQAPESRRERYEENLMAQLARGKTSP